MELSWVKFVKKIRPFSLKWKPLNVQLTKHVFKRLVDTPKLDGITNWLLIGSSDWEILWESLS